MQLLQKTRRMAEQDSKDAHFKNKNDHYKNASIHNYKIGDKVLINNQLFVSKNEKFAPVRFGPFEVSKIINEQNVEVKFKNRLQIYNVC